MLRHEAVCGHGSHAKEQRRFVRRSLGDFTSPPTAFNTVCWRSHLVCWGCLASLRSVLQKALIVGEQHNLKWLYTLVLLRLCACTLLHD